MTLFQIDAFTDRPFAGNPAAVCLLEEARDDAWMQSVAAELNLSETAFLQERAEGYDLRWFTPVVEVDLCGHATLASAHFLWDAGILAPGALARFHTRSGLLTATRAGEWIELDFPTEAPQPAAPSPGLLDALGVAPVYTGRNRFDTLVQVASEAEVRAARPDFAGLAEATERGVILTARAADPRFD